MAAPRPAGRPDSPDTARPAAAAPGPGSARGGLRQAALAALAVADPQAKLAALDALDDSLDAGAQDILAEPAGLPGRPVRPELVPPQRLRKRAAHTPAGLAALIHSLAHIEFNAINLALDAVWRFAGMPEQYYRDWARVAREEGAHFGLLAGHLRGLGHEYGAFPAHDGLWEMAERTRGDVLARMALVPRTLEARGLDASPVVRGKLAAAGDEKGAAIVDIILRDEVGHVAIGNQWYRYLCQKQGLDPYRAYSALAAAYRAPRLHGPFNLEARRAAGFNDRELEALQDDAVGI